MDSHPIVPRLSWLQLVNAASRGPHAGTGVSVGSNVAPWRLLLEAWRFRSTRRSTMAELNAFVSPKYPVLHSVDRSGNERDIGSGGHVALSLGLLVKGIPSFLATIPVVDSEVDGISDSLRTGDVRVAVVGVSVDDGEIAEEISAPEPWQQSPDENRRLPAAYLSLVCSDGRRIGVARIVAREGSATPEEVARFVLKQIAKGVQIPDLASAP